MALIFCLFFYCISVPRIYLSGNQNNSYEPSYHLRNRTGLYDHFDIPDENGEKSYERNIEAASKWPPTYSELSKSENGIHLHYIYTGDPAMLSRVYDDHIEVKVCKCQNSIPHICDVIIQIARISIFEYLVYEVNTGYSNEQLYNLSQKIINGSPNCFFGEAYNISYTDIYDFASAGNKKSLKKLI